MAKKLSFGIAVNLLTENFKKGTYTVKNSLHSMLDSFKDFGNIIGHVVKGLAAFGIGFSATSFVKQMFKVRSEFQNTEAMFKVFLGNGEKAKDFMRDMQKYAFNNVFEFKDLTQQAAQLLAYGTAAKDVIPVIDKLSNIASGVNEPLDRFVDLYNKAKSRGKLDLVDVQQWSAMGDVLGYLSEMLGKSKDEIRSMISTGNIGFKELDALINKLTESGGKFNGMMVEKMKTLGDSAGLLQDTITSVFNELGEKSEDFLRDGILLVNDLVENYEKIGKVIFELVATYGTYKAAVIALSVAENLRYQSTLAHMAGMTKMQAVMDVLKKKTDALNMAMARNPYVAVGLAVAALSYGTYKLATHQTDAEKAQSRLNDSMQEAQKNALGEQRDLAKLKGQLSATTKGSKEYNDIRDEIVKKFGQYHKNLKDEIDTVGLLDSTYRSLTDAIQKSFGARQYAKFAQQESDNLDDILSKNLGKIQDRLIDKLGDEAGSKYYEKIRQGIIDNSLSMGGYSTGGLKINGLDDETSKALEKISGIEGNDFFKNFAIEGAVKNILQAQKLADDLDKKAKIKFGIENPNKSDPEDDKEVEKFRTYGQQVDDARKKVTGLKSELENLKKGVKPSDVADGEQFDFSKGIEDKAKALKEAQDKLSFLLTGKSHSDAGKGASTAEKRLEALRKLDEEDRKRQIEKQKFDLDMQQKAIDLMDDSFDKSTKQTLLNLRKEQLAIEEYQNNLLKQQQEHLKTQYESTHGTDKGFEAYFTKLKEDDLQTLMPEGLRPEDIEKQVGALLSAAQAAQAKGLADINHDLSIMLMEQRVMFASDLDKKLTELDAYYNEQRIKAGNNAALLAQIEDNRTRAKQETKTDDRLKKLDFEEQLKLERVAGMESIGMTELVEEKKLEITKLYIQKRIDALDVLASMGDQEAYKQMDMLKASLKKLDVQKPVKSLKSLADKAIFDTIKKGFEKAGDSAEQAEDKTTKLLGSISAKAAIVANITSELQSMFGGMDEGLDMALETVGNIAQGFATGGVVGGAMAVIGEGMKLFSKASEAAARHQKALEEIAAARLASQRAYNLLLREQNLLLEEAVSVFGEEKIKRATNAIENYRQSIADMQTEMQGDFTPNATYEKYLEKGASSGGIMKGYFNKQLNDYRKQVGNYNKGIAALGNAQIVTGHKKTGLFGWGKGKDTYSSILDEYDDVLDKEGKLNVARIENIIATRKMSDETKAYLQNLVDLQDAAEAAQEELRNYLQSTFGVLGDDIMTSIENAIINKGVNAWEEFGKAGSKVLEQLGKQIAYELFFADKFKKLQSDLEGIYGSNKSPEEIARESADLVGKFYQNIGADMELAQGFMENWQKEAEKYGLELWNNDSTSQSASKGYSVAMDQDTGDKMVGILTSMQMSGFKMEGLLSVISLDTANIFKQTVSINSEMTKQTTILNNIYQVSRNSFFEVEGTGKNLKDINNKLSNIETYTKALE